MYVEELKKIFPVKNVKFIDLFELFSKYPIERFFTFPIDSDDEIFLTDGKCGRIDLFHPNPLGNAYIAKILLKQIFNIDFLPEVYIADNSSGIKSPKFK